ncbi:probable cytochrome P450 49a1 [Panonychus citri]|uniref:probable cytochrome P450 49a1 n=1 Tax=Panonychus citri TaxID=50023 RepID=UPI0023072962|nr:probable cytochrome P450 49a1 [Panonychus citri]
MINSRSLFGFGRQLSIQSSFHLGDGFNCFHGDSISRPLSSFTVTNEKSLDDVPCVSSIPYVGSILHYIEAFGGHNPAKIHELSEKRFHQFGSIYKEDMRLLRPGGKFMVWLNDANDVEKVFRSGGKYPLRGGFESLTVYRKTRPDVYKALGLPILSGPEWQSLRSKVQPVLLLPKVMNAYAKSLSSIADEMIGVIRDLRDNQTMEIEDLTVELYRYTLESIAFIGLDKRLNCLSDYGPTQREIVAAVKEMFHLEAKLNDSALWRIVGRPIGSKWARFFEINDHFTKMVFDYVSEKLKQILANPIKQEDEDRSVLELFLTRPNCTPEDAVTMVMDMFFAGIDTTAHYIVFTLHYLANNPEIQERVYHEINSLSNGTGNLDSDGLAQLTLLKACLKETSRLTPVTPMSMRINQEPINLSGYSISPSCFMVFNHYVMGRRPDYFDEPMRFNPDRWIRESPGENKYHPFAILPFGFGVRMCVGRRIAEIETLILLCKIITNFKVTAKRIELPTSMNIISYPDNPMTFTFNERQSNN